MLPNFTRKQLTDEIYIPAGIPAIRLQMACVMIRIQVAMLFFVSIGTGCMPKAYLNTPNDVYKQQGTIYLADGKGKKGAITIAFETGQAAGGFIELAEDGQTEKISLKDIRGYRIDSSYYALKELDIDFSGAKHFLFVKQLTRSDSRIQFYELYQSKKNVNGEDMYSYFISLPGQGPYETWNISGKNLVPGFDLKMSRIVNDCPDLANKILEKRKGYFLGAYTRSDIKKVRVFKNIIDEYNACTAKTKSQP